MTPFGIEVTVVSEVDVVWETAVDANAGFFGGAPDTAPLYTPPKGLYPDTGTSWGEFRLNSESIRVDCYFWHNAHGENVKLGRFGVNLGRLRDDADNATPEPDDDITASQLNCVSGNIDEDQVVARQWKITVTRNYSGRSQIGGISWKLKAPTGPSRLTRMLLLVLAVLALIR